MRSQAVLKSLPLLFGKAFAVSQERPNGGRTEYGNGGGVGRVETRDQGQRLPRNDSRQGKTGDLLRRHGEVLSQERLVLVLGAVEEQRKTTFEGRQTTATEVVVDFGLHGLHRRRGRGRRRTGRKNLRRFGFGGAHPGIEPG